MNYKDIAVRALKTFIQAFFGVVIPEVIAILNGGLTDFSAFRKALLPVIVAALSAGISAVWNYALRFLDKGEDVPDQDDAEADT